MAYCSYALTVRPNGGISDERIGAIEAWIMKTCEYYHIITEKTGTARHLHAALYLKKAVTRSNFINCLFAVKDFNLTPVEKKIQRAGVCIQYNHDWLNNYLYKQDNTEIISSTITADDLPMLEAFYPEKDDQRLKKTFKGSLWYVNMEKLWNESDFEIKDEEHVRAFVHNMMFVHRKIEVIDDARRLTGKIKSLTKFLLAEEMEVEYLVAPEVEALLGQFS